MTTQNSKTATFLRSVSEGLRGEGALYRVSDKYLGSDYVVTSRIKEDYYGDEKIETALFPADASGEIDGGSLMIRAAMGTLEHEPHSVPELSDEKVLAAAGYEVVAGE